MGSVISCELCDRKSDVRVGFRANGVNCGNIFFDMDKPVKLQKLLSESMPVGHKHWEVVGIENILFYQHICRHCYYIYKDDIHSIPPEGFELELDILTDGKYYHEKVGLP